MEILSWLFLILAFLVYTCSLFTFIGEPYPFKETKKFFKVAVAFVVISVVFHLLERLI